jgi:hypothetical protein
MTPGADTIIRKGFILKARKIEDSDIAHAPPHVREIWDLILRKANFRDRTCGRTTIRRGQWLTTYEEIQELLHWRIGFRKMTYSRWQIEWAMKKLRVWVMIATRKATRGLFITVVNYDFYQCLDNYDCHNERHNDCHNDATGQRRNGRRKEELTPRPLSPSPREAPTPPPAKPEALSDADVIFDRWNTHAGQSTEKQGKTITWKGHRRRPDGTLSPEIATAIQRCLAAGYSVEDICAAIDNFALVLLGPEFFWSYPWPLATFLTVADGRGKAGISKWTNFRPDNFIREQYLLKRPDGAQGDSEQDIGKLAGCEPADEDEAQELYQEIGLTEE